MFPWPIGFLFLALPALPSCVRRSALADGRALVLVVEIHSAFPSGHPAKSRRCWCSTTVIAIRTVQGTATDTGLLSASFPPDAGSTRLTRHGRILKSS